MQSVPSVREASESVPSALGYLHQHCYKLYIYLVLHPYNIVIIHVIPGCFIGTGIRVLGEDCLQYGMSLLTFLQSDEDI